MNSNFFHTFKGIFIVPCILICLHKFEFSFKIVYSVQNFKAFENLLNIPGFLCIISGSNVGGHCYVNLVRSLMIFTKIPLKSQSLLTLV